MCSHQHWKSYFSDWNNFILIHISMEFNPFVQIGGQICQAWLISASQFIFNSFAPGRCGMNFKCVISVHMLWHKFISTSCEIVLRWMPQSTFEDKSTLILVMASCQATNHFLSQCWPSSMLSCGVTSPRWVKSYQSLKKILSCLHLNYNKVQ